MKTTSYEISKKLKEEGFKAQSRFFWCRLDKDLIRIHISQSHSVPESIDKIKAYDLETLLDALPKKIKYREEEYCFGCNGLDVLIVISWAMFMETCGLLNWRFRDTMMKTNHSPTLLAKCG